MRLAGQSVAGYAAFLNLPGRALVSNSPERFLSVRREADGLWAESQPIKGTRPRGADPAEDARLAEELRASEKDRAENLMIVDLMRNDLARVCAPGTVRAPELWALRSYANVHHLVSRVRGRLGTGRTAWDAFLAAFPPGSVTGAPKLQAMRVIARHEPPRGPYCGSLFWAGPDGAL
jgi:para-aminobenzoate synthetase component 1